MKERGYASRDLRRDMIKSFLQRYKGSGIYCRALGRNVYITSKGISETAQHASRSVDSMYMALNLVYAIANAKHTHTTQAKQNRRQKDMNLFVVYVLECEFKDVGTAKLTIGKSRRLELLEYCITKKKTILSSGPPQSASPQTELTIVSGAKITMKSINPKK